MAKNSIDIGSVNYPEIGVSVGIIAAIVVSVKYDLNLFQTAALSVAFGVAGAYSGKIIESKFV